MRQLTFFLLIGLLDCIQSEQDRLEACAVALSRDDAFDFADTDSWHIGDLSFWTTPERIRSTYGAPFDSLNLRGSVWSYRFNPEEPTLFNVIGDSLAYPTQIDLRSDSLRTPNDVLTAGASVREVRALFPKSYRCRDFPLSPIWSDSEWTVWDSVRHAEIMLYFLEENLVGLGVSGYELEREALWEP